VCRLRRANIARDVPFVILKMSLYEELSRRYLASKSLSVGYRSNTSSSSSSSSLSAAPGPGPGLSSVEAGGVGFVSGALTALLTAPMDNVNTRMKSGEGGFAALSLRQAHLEVLRRDGAAGLFRGLGPRVVITGVGSTMFWFVYSQLQKHIH
jgi:hypothetical protein